MRPSYPDQRPGVWISLEHQACLALDRIAGPVGIWASHRRPEGAHTHPTTRAALVARQPASPGPAHRRVTPTRGLFAMATSLIFGDTLAASCCLISQSSLLPHTGHRRGLIAWPDTHARGDSAGDNPTLIGDYHDHCFALGRGCAARLPALAARRHCGMRCPPSPYPHALAPQHHHTPPTAPARSGG